MVVVVNVVKVTGWVGVVNVVKVTDWVGVVNVVEVTGLVVESMRKKDGLGVCGQ